MTGLRPTARSAGWVMAGAIALGLIGGAAAFALAAERRASALILDLGVEPPSAPAIAAVAEAAPEVAAADPVLAEPSGATEATPVLPEATPRPILAAATPLSQPEIERPVAAEVALPAADAEPLSEPLPRPKARPEPKSEPEAKPEKRGEKARTDEPRRADQPASAASAASSGTKAKGGGLSAAAYAKAVLKQVRATKKQSGAGKGRVVVGFTIAPDGGLASVTVLQSSGNAVLDRIALDHIRRSAPFPAPPSDARPGYSFEFVGK